MMEECLLNKGTFMRVKSEIKYPTGYPFILYQVINKKKKVRRFTAAATDHRAISNAGFRKAECEPADVCDMIKEFGHKKTSEIISTFYPRWICKEGKVFYEKVK